MKNDIWINTDLGSLDAQVATAADTTPDQTRSPLLDAKVMMVDDEPLMTALIETHLEDAGYTNFVSSNDPRQALEMLRRERPGVLLLDLMMPQLSGFDVLEAIRADRDLRYTPVIVLTAATSAQARLRALHLGATDFLSKPVDESELVLRVRNTLAFQQYADRALNYDAITDLPNERLFSRGLDHLVARAPLAGGLACLFSIELPDLRAVATNIGEQAAGDLARVVARRLQRFVDAHSPAVQLATSTERAPRVGRTGVERFAVLIEGLASVDAVQAVARRLAECLCEVVSLGLHELAPAAWIGVAMTPADGNDGQTLRKSADLAALHAREHGGLPVMFASAELNARALERLTLGSQLRGAARRGELLLHYQPKVDLVSNRVVGAEALVRWQHPAHGLMPPGRFIPLAEELGLINGIGDWVLERACQDAARWAEQGLGQLKVAVNVAKPQFLAGTLTARVRQALFDSGLRPDQLVIELTESMLMDDVTTAVALMDELKDLGVTLSIDDFGTGYSSFSHLSSFPLDELKIDRSFVGSLFSSTRADTVVGVLVHLGHQLHMSVIAEGVETEPQRAFLARLGCDRYQGFLFSRPVPVQDFVALARRQQAVKSG